MVLMTTHTGRIGAMSTRAQKVFAKAISLGETPEGETFREGIERMGPMYFIDQNGQKRTMHGDIPFDDPVEQDIERTDSKSHEEPEPENREGARVYPDHDAPPESPPPRQKYYSYDTQPKRTGWIRPTPTPPRRTFKEFERWMSDCEARSDIRRRNRGDF